MSVNKAGFAPSLTGTQGETKTPSGGSAGAAASRTRTGDDHKGSTPATSLKDRPVAHPDHPLVVPRALPSPQAEAIAQLALAWINTAEKTKAGNDSVHISTFRETCCRTQDTGLPGSRDGLHQLSDLAEGLVLVLRALPPTPQATAAVAVALRGILSNFALESVLAAVTKAVDRLEPRLASRMDGALRSALQAQLVETLKEPSSAANAAYCLKLLGQLFRLGERSSVLETLSSSLREKYADHTRELAQGLAKASLTLHKQSAGHAAASTPGEPLLEYVTRRALGPGNDAARKTAWFNCLDVFETVEDESDRTRLQGSVKQWLGSFKPVEKKQEPGAL